MSELSYYRLGTNPSTEALRVQLLNSDEGVDQAVKDEFPVAVEAYSSLSLSDVEKRLRNKYTGESNAAIAFIPVHDERLDIGMSVTGLQDFHSPVAGGEGIEMVSGVNISAWLLRQFRCRGFGRQVIAHTTQVAIEQVQDTSDTGWHGRQIWTSIHRENAASIKVCKAAGFEEAGVHVTKPDRLLYLLSHI